MGLIEEKKDEEFNILKEYKDLIKHFILYLVLFVMLLVLMYYINF